MGVICLVDVSLSMICGQGSVEKDKDGEEATNGYVSAVSILGKLLREISVNTSEQVVTIFRGCKKIENVPLDQMEDTLLKDKSLSGSVSMGTLFKEWTESKAVCPTDTLIVFTDMKTYKADITHFPPCNTRFVNVINYNTEFSEQQTKELAEVASMSLDPVTKIVRKEHFGSLQILDSSEEELVATLVMHHFATVPLTIHLGFFEQKFKLAPLCSSISIGGLNIVGFVKATSTMNAPTLSHHKVVTIDPPPKEEADAPAVTKPKISNKRPAPMDVDSSSEGRDTPTKKMDFDDSDEEKSERRVKREKKMRKCQIFQRYVKRRLRVLRRMRCRPAFLDMLAGCLAEEEMVAICHYKSGQYSVLNAVTDDDGEVGLFLSILPMEAYDFQPDFNNLIVEPWEDDSKEPVGSDLHIVDKEGVPPSYDSNYRCWTTSQGLSTDVQKMFRLLRKLPDKHSLFYQEVNSFRDYALMLGMTELLKEMARILHQESASLKVDIQTHALYVATWFEKDVDPTDYTNIPAL